MKQAIERLVRYAVSCARAYELDEKEIQAASGSEGHHGEWGHENYKYAAGVFLALYVTEHPANPYAGKPEALERYLALADRWVKRWEDSLAAGDPVHYSEWPPMIINRGLERLGDELDAGRRERWERFIAWFVEEGLPGPFFFTAPNHEAWGLAVASLASRVLGRPEWLKQVEFKTLQILKYQTAEGFWEEGRHHGPAMKYNSLMLSALTIVAAETGNAEIRAAAGRLAAFMARWIYPDGVTAGVFDGRQSTSPGYFGRLVPGLELAPDGATSIKRIMDFWERAGWLDEPRAAGPSNWYTHFGFPFAAEALLYFGSPDFKPPETAPLAADSDGAVLENHTTEFDATTRRWGPWIAAVSGQLSDVPKDTQFIYRLERQNRIDLWHRKASVVLGGGHSLVTAPHPVYNAWVETGYGRKPGLNEVARGGGEASSPEMALRRSKYYPRATSSGTRGAASWLELVFAHATVRFEVEPDGDDMAVRYQYECMGVKDLRLALPLVLWRTARGSAGGEAFPEAADHDDVRVFDVEGPVVVETPIFESKTTLTLPSAGRTRITWPIDPIRTYGVLFAEEHFSSFFRMAMVETVIDDPGPSGSGQWKVSVE